MYQFGFETEEIERLLTNDSRLIESAAKIMHILSSPDGETDSYIVRGISYVVPKGQGFEIPVMFADTFGWWYYATARWSNDLWKYKIRAIQLGGGWEPAYHEHPWRTWEEIRGKWHVYDEDTHTWANDWPIIAGGFPLAIGMEA
jgi:hypothetical protein